ncbi:MAG TPA: DUF389 domain-containing protein [Luteibacter sp.]|jgi:uncharacterized hydrophobic protein (TIGR00271 family)|nr:DUF389 domain-containing protein [Luteibacter sp.]
MYATAQQWWARRYAGVDHEIIRGRMDEDGVLNAGYLFMCAMAAGIATIGLLCNSASVIIGAMLVSPLMGPIVRLGLGLATLNPPRVLRSVAALVAGMAVSLLVSMLIVRLSPLRLATPEILARTNPNLFDMIAATLSGLAGGYATIRNRGGTIVGVAIATALMPPMAVVGYGLSVGEWAMARGALLLFATNLATIALSVTLMCTWYGFSGVSARRAVAWQAVLGIAVLLPLALPLTHALGTITRERLTLSTVRSALTTTYGDDSVRVLDMHMEDNGTLDLTFAVRRYGETEDRALRASLASSLTPGTTLRLNPVITADPAGSLGAKPLLSSPLVGIGNDTPDKPQ